jgi:putative transposase
VENGETPGFPRFKALSRYKGWGYATYGDGWSFKEFLNENGEHTQNPRLYLKGITGTMQIRGKVRNVGVPTTAEVIRRQGKWYLSVTYDCTDIKHARVTAARNAIWMIIPLLRWRVVC